MPSRRTTIFRSLPAAAIFAAAMLLWPVAADPPVGGHVRLDGVAPFHRPPRVVDHSLVPAPIENSSLLEGDGEDVSGISGSVKIFAGGPVQQELGFVVHSAEYHLDETLDVDGRVAMTANRQVLRDIGRNLGPVKSLFALGYAGWGPGQLEGELARSDWFTTPAEPRLIFDDDRANLWEEAMARRTRDL